MSRPRRSRLRPWAAVAAAAALIGGLTACTPAETEPVAITPLACIDDAWNGGPVRTATVDCTQPHRFEVVSVIDPLEFPVDVWDPEETTALEAYTRIVTADPQDELAAWYHSAVSDVCAADFDALLGFDELMIGENRGVELGLQVTAPYALVTSLATAEDFAAHDQRTVCAVAWLDGQGGLARTSHLASADLRALAGPGLALERRECITFSDGGAVAASCTEPHAGQVIIDFDALTALGPDWVAAVDPSNGRARNYRASDDMCAAILESLLPEGTLARDRTVWSDIRPTDGWVDFAGPVDTERRYPVSCAVTTKDRTPALTTDLWG